MSDQEQARRDLVDTFVNANWRTFGDPEMKFIAATLVLIAEYPCDDCNEMREALMVVCTPGVSRSTRVGMLYQATNAPVH